MSSTQNSESYSHQEMSKCTLWKSKVMFVYEFTALKTLVSIVLRVDDIKPKRDRPPSIPRTQYWAKWPATSGSVWLRGQPSSLTSGMIIFP